MPSQNSHKTPWQSHPEIWPSESRFWSWIRGGIRLGLWNKHPLKLEHIKKHRFKIDNGFNKDGSPKKPVWAGKCAICEGVFKQKDLEVDHKSGNHSLKSLEDVGEFIKNIVLVTEDDLQMVCKPCHRAKNLADRNGTSVEEAILEKEVIAIMKQSAGEQCHWLYARNIVPASNAEGRRKQIKERLKEERDAD